jgi:hypothetical protein
MPKIKKSANYRPDPSRSVPEIPEDRKFYQAAEAIRKKRKEMDDLVHSCLLKAARAVLDASSLFERDAELEELTNNLREGLQHKDVIAIGRGTRNYPPAHRLGDYDLGSRSPEVAFVLSVNSLESGIDFWAARDFERAHEETVRVRAALRTMTS